jgi:hypothetical protein
VITFGLPLTGAASLGGNRGGVNDDLRRVRAGQQATVTADHRLEVLVRRHHDEDDVAVGHLGGAVNDLRAVFREPLGLRPGPVVRSDVVTGLQQAQGELVAHSPGTDPSYGGRRGGGHATSFDQSFNEMLAAIVCNFGDN